MFDGCMNILVCPVTTYFGHTWPSSCIPLIWCKLFYCYAYMLRKRNFFFKLMLEIIKSWFHNYNLRIISWRLKIRCISLSMWSRNAVMSASSWYISLCFLFHEMFIVDGWILWSSSHALRLSREIIVALPSFLHTAD
jgi:hypothetical protein